MWSEKDGDVLIIKNFKELCCLLHCPYCAGNSAKAIKNALDNYCKYHLEGHKIVITKVYDIPKEVIRKGSRTKYADKYEDVLLYYLNYNNKKNRYFTNKLLWEKTGLINHTYVKYDNDKTALCKCLTADNKSRYNEDILIRRIFNAYDIIYDKARQINKSALDFMERHKTIEYSPVYFLSFNEYNGTHILKKGDLFYNDQERFLIYAEEYALSQAYSKSDFAHYAYKNRHCLYRSHDKEAIKIYEEALNKYWNEFGRKIKKLIDIKPLVSISINSNDNALNQAILNQLVLKGMYDEIDKYMTKHTALDDNDKSLLRRIVTILVSASTEQVKAALDGQDVTPYSAEELKDDF